MKTKLLSKSSLIVPTAFFIGILASSYFMFFVGENHESNQLILMRMTIVITMFMGLISLYVMAFNRSEKIVYVEKKEKKAERREDVGLKELSQLDVDSIERVFNGSDKSLQSILNEVCHQLQAGQGSIYVVNQNILELKIGYALVLEKEVIPRYEIGEGLIGRVAAEGKVLYIDKLPKDYMTIFSGLGTASPSYLIIVPLVSDSKVSGVMEISTFHPLNKITIQQMEEVGKLIGGLIQN